MKTPLIAAEFQMRRIGILHTCFKEKFGIPRQPGLSPHAWGVLKLEPDPLYVQAVKELHQFSHLWLVFVFHGNTSKSWKPSIRPPRLGGAKKVGVLASRSPHRPNPIGLSAVRLEKIDLTAPGGIEIHLSGVDVLDGTPILDIKPYLPYADSIPDASSGWAAAPIRTYPIVWTAAARVDLERCQNISAPHLEELITSLLALDPRPAFQKKQDPADPEPGAQRKSANGRAPQYGFRVVDFDVKWQICDGVFQINRILDWSLESIQL